MRSDNIDIHAGVPVLSDHPGVPADPFAFARRLRTAVWVFDIDHTRIIFANDAACELWQADNEDALRQRDLAADMSPTVAKRLRQYQIDFVERDASFNEMWTLYPKGQPKSAMVVFSGLCLPDGRMAMLCEVVGDANDEPTNLRSAEALLHTDVMISLYELGGPPLYMNPAARNAAVKAMQIESEKFLNPKDYLKLVAALEQTGQCRMVTKVMTASGPKWHDISTKLCSDAVTGHPVVLETAIDVSELKIARDKARYLAERDQLTGCFNRTFLAQYISLLESTHRTRCAVLSLDVDHFKQINDRFGHEMGDIVLKKIVKRISSSIRASDIIIRLGGDEFVVVLENTTSRDELEKRVERIREKISRPISHAATKLAITASIGVTEFSSDVADFAAIMSEADLALYSSKQSGRNRVTYFNETMGAARRKRNSLETELKRSIEDNDFVLHFQPRVDLQSGQVVSAEALVRWQHPERGLIMPGEFIPVCEETGMIEDLGQLIVDLGHKQASDWHRSGLDIGLSLNISPRQFEDIRLLNSLRDMAETSTFPTDKIELEITESVLIGDLNAIEQKLKVISDIGYRIAIDDFGTGYSNLSYISRFPLDCLKIDQSFVNRLPESGPIINLIVTLAAQIGATVVAEGIETQEQLQWLTRQGCGQGQGYFLSRPVPIDEFNAALSMLHSTNDSIAKSA